MGQALEFEILNEDNVVAYVFYDYDTQKLVVENYGKSIMDSLILGPDPTLASIQDWFEERCFPRTRVDRDFLLKSLGLTEYIPYNIVKKTNGILFDDKYWIRFKEKSHLIWADVNPRRDDMYVRM